MHMTVVVTCDMRQVRGKTDNPPDITWLSVLFGKHQRIDHFFLFTHYGLGLLLEPQKVLINSLIALR